MLKFAIVVFMIALIASLGSGFYYLMIDQGEKTKRRTFHSLAARISLAICLLGLIIYGVASGQIGHRNPWDGGPVPAGQESLEQD